MSDQEFITKTPRNRKQATSTLNEKGNRDSAPSSISSTTSVPSNNAADGISLRPRTMFAMKGRGRAEPTEGATYRPQWSKDGEGFVSGTSSASNASTTGISGLSIKDSGGSDELGTIKDEATRRKQKAVLRYSKEELLALHVVTSVKSSIREESVVSEHSLPPVNSMPFDHEEMYRQWALNRNRGRGRGRGSTTDGNQNPRHAPGLREEGMNKWDRSNSSQKRTDRKQEHEEDDKWERGIKPTDEVEDDIWDDVLEAGGTGTDMDLTSMAEAAEKFRKEMDAMKPKIKQLESMDFDEFDMKLESAAAAGQFEDSDEEENRDKEDMDSEVLWADTETTQETELTEVKLDESIATSVDSVADEWFYLDPQGIQQGPFSTEDMRSWFEAGYFKPHLPVRYGREGQFTPLASQFIQGQVPFARPLKLDQTATQMSIENDEAERQRQMLLEAQEQQKQAIMLQQQQQQQHLQQQQILAMQQQQHHHHLQQQHRIIEENRRLEMEIQQRMSMGLDIPRVFPPQAHFHVHPHGNMPMHSNSPPSAAQQHLMGISPPQQMRSWGQLGSHESILQSIPFSGLDYQQESNDVHNRSSSLLRSPEHPARETSINTSSNSSANPLHQQQQYEGSRREGDWHNIDTSSWGIHDSFGSESPPKLGDENILNIEQKSLQQNSIQQNSVSNPQPDELNSTIRDSNRQGNKSANPWGIEKNSKSSTQVPSEPNTQNGKVKSLATKNPHENASTSENLLQMGAQLKMMLGVSSNEEVKPVQVPTSLNKPTQKVSTPTQQTQQKQSLPASKPAQPAKATTPNPPARSTPRPPNSSPWGTPDAVASTSSSGSKSLREILAEEERLAIEKAKQQNSSGSSSSHWVNVVAGTSAPAPILKTSRSSLGPVPTSVLKSRRSASSVNPSSDVQSPTNESDVSFWNFSAATKDSPSKSKSIPSDSQTPAFGATSLSPEFKSWCSKQLKLIGGTEDLTLIAYCASLDDPSEIRENLAAYLGSTPKVSAFASEFIQRKKRGICSSDGKNSSSGNKIKSIEENILTSGKKGKRRTKGHKIDPSLLNYSVGS